MRSFPATLALTALAITVVAGAAVQPQEVGTSGALHLTYDVRVTFLMAANMGEPDHASAEGSGEVLVDVEPVNGSVRANLSSSVRLEIDYRELLELFSSLNRTWSRELGSGELIVLNETGMNAFLDKVVREVRPGLVVERSADLGEWGGRPALELRIRVSNNESRPEYLMLYRVGINGTYYYDLSTGYLLESSLRYWVITSKGPMQIYMNGTAEYRLRNPDTLPLPGKARTYWFRIGDDVGKVIVSWEGGDGPGARLEDGEIVIGGEGTKIVSVAVLSPHEPVIKFGGRTAEPATHPLSLPWGSFTIMTVGAGELRIGFEEGVDEVSESPPGGGLPWHAMAVAGAGAVAAAVALAALRRRRG